MIQQRYQAYRGYGHTKLVAAILALDPFQFLTIVIASAAMILLLAGCANPAPADDDPATWPPPALTQSNIEGVRQSSFGASIAP